jgi:hypothetical protein
VTIARRQIKRRPSDEAVAAALPVILRAAAGATHMTAEQALATPRVGRSWRSADRRTVSAILVAAARALVSRSVRVKDAIRHLGIGTTIYTRGVPPDLSHVERAAITAAARAIPADDSRAARRARADAAIAEVAARRGLSTTALLERNTVAARQARAEVVRLLRDGGMSIPQVAAAIGFTRLTCYRLARGGYHTASDRRSPMGRAAAAGQQAATA